jgi:type IV pilus assembly protein PilE
MIHPNLIRHRGFTLIELMIVVAVIGLLAVVAYPSFQQSIIKSDRSDARTALAEILLAQERFKQASATNSYTSTVTDLATTMTVRDGKLVSPRGLYEVAIDAPATVTPAFTASLRGGFIAFVTTPDTSKQFKDRVSICRNLAIRQSLGGEQRGHMSQPDGGTFVESTECW